MTNNPLRTVMIFVVSFASIFVLGYFISDKEVEIKPTQTFNIKGGTFNNDVFFIVGNDTTDVKRLTGWEHYLSHYNGITSNDTVWIADGDDQGLVAHEMLHVVSNCLNWAGVPFSPDTEEVYAYELQRLMYNFYNKYGKEQ